MRCRSEGLWAFGQQLAAGVPDFVRSDVEVNVMRLGLGSDFQAHGFNIQGLKP